MEFNICSILVLICVFEMISCFHLLIWAIDLVQFLCFFRVYDLWNWWRFEYYEDASLTSMQDLQNKQFCYMNQSFYFLALFFEFSYYIVMCLDLIITLKWPFISGKSRMVYYHIGVIGYSFLIFGLIWNDIQSYCNSTTSPYCAYQNAPVTNSFQLDQETGNKPTLFIAYKPILATEVQNIFIDIKLIFYLVGTVSIIMAISARKKHSRVNNELYEAKNQYLLNHVVMIMMLFSVWLIPFTNNILSSTYSEQIELLNNLSFLILLSQGFFLALVRLRERFFREIVFLFIRTLLGKASRQEVKTMEAMEEKDNADLDAWNFSLAMLVGKAQNQEVVSHILQGVLNITQYQTTSTIISASQSTLPLGDRLKKWCIETKKKKFSAKDDPDNTLTSFRSSYKSSSMNLENVQLSQSLIQPNEIADFEETTVTEYAPQVFQVIRNADDLTSDVFKRSLSIKKNESQIKKAQQSLGKSGSFFFFSYDNRLILKTMSQTELNVLLKEFLRDYVFHISGNPSSLLAKVYGAYTITIAGVAPINLILMENTLGPLEIMGGANRLYDLKGSLVNRFVRVHGQTRTVAPTSSNESAGTILQSVERDRLVSLRNPIVTSEMMIESQNERKQVRVLKDLNFLQSDDLFISLSHQKRDQLSELFKRDTDFLRQTNIMDYSLLLGMAPNIKPNYDAQLQNENRMITDEKGNVLSIAIIDYLQVFDLFKQLEFRYKTIIKQSRADQISCILPKQYQERFLSFMGQIICIVERIK